MPSIDYQISESTTADGGLHMELHVEESRLVHATISPATLEELRTKFGATREDVIEQLRGFLRKAIKTHGQLAEITHLTEDPDQYLLFHAWFMYRIQDKVTTGWIWYDVMGEQVIGPGERMDTSHEMNAAVSQRLRIKADARAKRFALENQGAS